MKKKISLDLVIRNLKEELDNFGFENIDPILFEEYLDDRIDSLEDLGYQINRLSLV